MAGPGDADIRIAHEGGLRGAMLEAIAVGDPPTAIRR